MKRHIFALVFLIALSWWAVRPLFIPGFFPMHDDTQVGRVVAMGRALRNGQFPVRWVSDLGYGYGYPIFNFYGPLPYYVGGLLYTVGFSGLLATKIMFALGIILATLTMYAATVSFLGRLGAIVAGAFYLYAPYHAVQIYVRGAVGEFWTLVFLPLILLGLWSKSKLIGGIGLAGAILSHTLLGYATTLLLFIGLVLYWFARLVWKKFDSSQFIVHSSLFIVGLGLSAFFWLPAIMELSFTHVAAQIGPTANFTDHFVCLPQLWNSPWGFGGSAMGCLDGLSFKLGKVHVVLSAVAIALFIVKRRSLSSQVFLTGLTFTITSIFLLSSASTFVWNSIAGFSYLQYPWRFLAFAAAGVSILVGEVIAVSRNQIVRAILTSVFIATLLIVEAKWFAPQFTYAKDARDFETPQELRFRVSKISDEYLPPEVPRPRQITEISGPAIAATGILEVGTDIDKETYKKFALLSKINQKITIAHAYFPGWRYWVNGKEALEYLTQGLPVLSLPEGESVVEMRFTNTPVRTFANILSLLTLLYLMYIYGKKTYA